MAEPSTAAQVGAFNGIRVVTGVNSTHPPTKNCVTIGGTTAAEKNTMTGTGTGGAADLRLFQRFTTILGILGYAGANNDNAAMERFLRGLNNVSNGAQGVLASNNVSAGGPGYSGTCPAP